MIAQYHTITVIEQESKGTGKRQMKSQGSAKLGSQCSAYIKASENLDTKNVNVKYCCKHYNHESKLAFLRIPEKIKLEIANKIQKGISIERILDDIRDSFEDTLKRGAFSKSTRCTKYQTTVQYRRSH